MLPVEVNRLKIIMQHKETEHKEICSRKIINLMQLKPSKESVQQQLFSTARQFYCRMEKYIIFVVRNISHFANFTDNELDQTLNYEITSLWNYELFNIVCPAEH
jgi:hypothetical protein